MSRQTGSHSLTSCRAGHDPIFSIQISGPPGSLALIDVLCQRGGSFQYAFIFWSLRFSQYTNFRLPQMFLPMATLSEVSQRLLPSGSKSHIIVVLDVAKRSSNSDGGDSDPDYSYNCDENGDDTVGSIDNPDQGMPESDRVLRPRVEWINPDVSPDPKTCEVGDDNCDNGGSSNCAL